MGCAELSGQIVTLGRTISPIMFSTVSEENSCGTSSVVHPFGNRKRKPFSSSMYGSDDGDSGCASCCISDDGENKLGTWYSPSPPSKLLMRLNCLTNSLAYSHFSWS